MAHHYTDIANTHFIRATLLLRWPTARAASDIAASAEHVACMNLRPYGANGSDASL